MWRSGMNILFVVVLLNSTAHAGKFNKKLSVGDPAPSWSRLSGTDGQEHSLADYDADALLVVFTCNQCPVATEYQGRLKQMAADYQRLAIVAINVNRGKSETLEKMTARAAKQKFPFDYLKDDSQSSARNYGARSTPTFFLLDSNRRIAYMGACDDNSQAAAAVEQHYLRDAVEAVLAGRKPEVAETRAVGCGISYDEEEE